MFNWIALGTILAATIRLPLEARPADGPPAAQPAGAQAQPAPAAGPATTIKKQRLPFLGMATTEAESGDRSPAGLSEGIGLVVQFVSPETPAEQAGLRRNDVLHTLDGQILVNNAQFRVLLRTHQPGDTVTLQIVRQGRPMSVAVRLGETEAVAAAPGLNQLRVGQFSWTLAPATHDTPRPPVGFMANYQDAEHVLLLRNDERGKYLLAKDKQGVVLFQGPVTSAHDRQAIPPSLLPKLEAMETPPVSQLSSGAEREHH